MSETAGGTRGLAVSLRGLWRRYGATTAVAGVSLEIGAGEFVSLLGPSGSGKTTLLMILAGFEVPDAGSVLVGGRDVTHLAPNRREVAMVFQRYALFPHMTVAENIGFPLKMRRIGRAERQRRTDQVLELVELAGYGSRRPSELSGGQQQRVALARAIVFDPPVILMDEPLGALDKKLRQAMQIEIKQLQQRLGATVIYVTHDQEEALRMSDRVAVMNNGRLLQVGRPRELYSQPADAFVADFLGEMNFLNGTLAALGEGTRMVDIAGARLEARRPAAGALGAAVRVAIRPELVTLSRERGALRGRVRQAVFNGASTILLLETQAGATLKADVNPRSELSGLRPGDEVMVGWEARDAHTFARSSE